MHALAHKPTQGFALLVMLALITGMGLAASKIYSTQTQQARLQQQLETENATALLELKTGLIAFAQLQGHNSHSHVGNLVCPALTPDAPPQTTCVHNNLGYFPMESVVKVNYLRNTVPALWNYTQTSKNKAWAYAVSKQVIQPNTLGWSQWVDFKQAPLTVRMGNKTTTRAVAVIASAIDIGPDGVLTAQAPAIWIEQAELENAVTQARIFHTQNTLSLWKTQHPVIAGHENLLQTGMHSFKPVHSQCACRCTTSLCTCQCAQPANWVSKSACKTQNGQCTLRPDQQTQCQSTPAMPCVFKGAAGLASLWPVSNFSPAPVQGRTCRPTQARLCPTSQTATACECAFTWPASTLNALEGLEIEWVEQGGQDRFRVKQNAS